MASSFACCTLITHLAKYHNNIKAIAVGALVMAGGKIAEMRTSEGKTPAAVLTVYLLFVIELATRHRSNPSTALQDTLSRWAARFPKLPYRIISNGSKTPISMEEFLQSNAAI